jgi:hypothetical protein
MKVIKTILIRAFRIILLVGLISTAMYWFYPQLFNRAINVVVWKIQKYATTKKSVNEVLANIGNDAKERLLPWFEKANVAYPPQRLALLGFKAENGNYFVVLEQEISSLSFLCTIFLVLSREGDLI